MLRRDLSGIATVDVTPGETRGHQIRVAEPSVVVSGWITARELMKVETIGSERELQCGYGVRFLASQRHWDDIVAGER